MYDHIKTANINAYMKDLDQYPRITHERERELYELMHSGDPVKADAAREELITSNLRIVVKLAHAFKQFMPFDDLVQEGNLGLIKAADKFDPDKCPKFSVVAASWAKQMMRKAILAQQRTVRIPGGAAQMAAKIAKTRNRLEAATGKVPTNHEIAMIIGVTEQRVDSHAQADIQMCSLDDTVNDDSPTTFNDMLHETIDDHDDGPEDVPDAIKDLRVLITRMPDKDRFLMERSYGIGCEPLTVDVLAQETGMSPQCINGRLCSWYSHLHEVLTDKGYSF